jgi:protein-tyrosine kinase
MLRHNNKRAMITEINPYSPISESYRALRTHLYFAGEEGSLQVLTCASAMPGEGKTTTLVNIAITYAQEGKKVIVVDADLRRPKLHDIFTLSNHIGLSNIVRHPYDISDVIRETNIHHLHVLPSGSVSSRPTDLLAGKRMISLIAKLREEYDIVLIDAPPVLAVTDSQIIASLCDGVIFVVHATKSKTHQVKKAKDQLERVRANVLGVVLNGKKRSSERALYSYYYGRTSTSK